MKKVIFVLLVASLAVTGCSFGKKQDNEQKPVEQTQTTQNPVTEQPSTTPTTSVERSVTTGVEDTSGLNKHNGFAVMIENSPASRPHTGLASADIVYEVETEANITRFMAIFHDKLPEKVGPVRSSRHYFLPLSQEWNSPYIHFGGSPQAYELLKSFPLTHIDGITKGSYFERDKTRKAPHNAYLYTQRLPQFSTPMENQHFEYGNKEYLDATNANNIFITYNSFTRIRYDYDKTNNRYLRFLEGAKHEDRDTKEQIAPTNIIVQYANHKALNDDKGRIDVELNTQGKAVYYMSGKKIEGTWKKENDTTVYLDGLGNKIILNPGKTWIQIVDGNTTISEK